MSAATRPGSGRPVSLGAAMLGLLVLEFLLGMALALFVTLPSGSPLTILASSPLLAVHVVVGLALIAITANALRWTLGSASNTAKGVATLGLVSAVGAFLAGMAFAFGDQSAIASYAMSVGFAGVLLDAGYLLSLGSHVVGAVREPGPAPAPSEA